ncbi:YesN/AraC family two-component response regulator [Evansella vedderi]|uniref:YesN/AraC family two-component response regulator n=1 Tax=Evansella vedderi TaxID=38282 RepID=A0ABT9ZXG0_9BACI|nr:response regulator [Evansella vedderi]MDQ0255921.1 YesN/AraC family two-component response regulator [Evansella vedderi]
MIKSKTILIVDDEPRTREGIKKKLDIWAEGKLEILMASDGSEAMEIFNRKKINLIITDIRMPEMTGLRMLESIKQKKQNPVVIIMSAYSEFDYAQEAIRLGVVNYLLKPVSSKKLIEAVEEALEIEALRDRTGRIENAIDHKLIDLKQIELEKESPIQEAMKFVAENLQTQFNLKDVAKHIHLNPSYFSALFKEQTDLNFSEYVTRSRVQKAKKLLLTTNLSINEISEKVGYQTTKYFIKVFKEYEKMTPSKYRKEFTDSESVF